VLADLAEQVARDGEGARHFGRDHRRGRGVEKIGAQDRDVGGEFAAGEDAIAGEDANWGRVVMAVGKAGEPANRDRLSISFNGHAASPTVARRDPAMTRARSRRR